MDGEGAGEWMQSRSGSAECLPYVELQHQVAALARPRKRCPFFISACENLEQTFGDKHQDAWLRQEKPFGSPVLC